MVVPALLFLLFVFWIVSLMSSSLLRIKSKTETEILHLSFCKKHNWPPILKLPEKISTIQQNSRQKIFQVERYIRWKYFRWKIFQVKNNWHPIPGPICLPFCGSAPFMLLKVCFKQHDTKSLVQLTFIQYICLRYDSKMSLNKHCLSWPSCRAWYLLLLLLLLLLDICCYCYFCC